MRILFASLLGLSLAACASKQPAKPETAQSPAAATDQAAFNKIAAKEAETMKLTLKPAHAAPHAASATHHSKRGPVPSEKALGWLKNGNTRFVKHFLRNDGDSAKDRTRLTAGQKTSLDRPFLQRFARATRSCF